MLIRPDATFIDRATNRAERVFPRGTDWRMFESVFPNKDVFANSVLDPAVGIAGPLAVKTFAMADWQNWLSTTKISLYEIGTRVGLPQLEDTPLATGLATVYDTISSSLDLVRQFDNPAELVPELLVNTGLQIVQQLAGQSNMITQTVAQVLAAAVWAVDVVRSHVESELAKHVSYPPLQTEDPATDTWQVNRVFEVFRNRGTGGVVFPDGEIEPASNADYTSLYLPAYRPEQPWRVQLRHNGIAVQQGHPTTTLGPGGDDAQYQFNPGDASTFGFMPGTATTLRVLQTSYHLYHTVRGTPVDRYSLRCRGVNKPCWKSVKTFNGSRDCRQCVDAESVWPVQGLGWAYGGSPLNATTPGENVGAFYPSTNKMLMQLLDMVSRPGPLLYTIDVEEIHRQWKLSFEYFWEFARAEWRRYNGTGYRGLISRLVTLMTAFEWDGDVYLGGRELHMPTDLIANPRESAFEISFADSIFSRIIEPFCRDVYNLQGHYLDTFSVAYIPPGAGAIYSPTGKIKKNRLGDRFLAARRNLLAANKRVLIDLRQVSDPDYRGELSRVGVKASPVNQKLHGSPGVSGHELLVPDIKPRRAPHRPRISRASPLEGAIRVAELGRIGAFDLESPGRPRPRAGVRTRRAGEDRPDRASRAAGIGLGLTAITAAVTAATVVRLRKMTDE